MKHFLLLWSCLFSFQVVHAQARLTTTSYYVLQAKDFMKALTQSSTSGHESQVVPTLNIPSPYSSTLQHIKIDFDYSLAWQTPTQFQNPVALPLTLTFSSASISIDSVITAAVLDQYTNGAHVTIHLDGQCSQLKLQTASSFSIAAKLNLSVANNAVTSQVTELNVTSLPSWSIDTGNCMGPNGYAAALKQALQDRLQDKTLVQSLLLNPLQQKINSVLATVNSEIFKNRSIPIAKNITANLQPQLLSMNGNGSLQVQSQLSVEVAGSPSQLIQDDTNSTSDFNKTSTSGLFISQSFIQKLNSLLYQNGMLKTTLSSTSFGGFDNLLSNSFYEFFVWPDLMNYPRNSEFFFVINPQQPVQMQLLGPSQGLLWFNVVTQIRAKMLAPKNGNYVNYVEFRTPLVTQLWMTVSNGSFNYGLYNPQTSLSVAWYESYLKNYQPNTSMNVSIMESKIKGALGEWSSSFNLPQIDMGSGFVLKAKSLSTVGAWYQLGY